MHWRCKHCGRGCTTSILCTYFYGRASALLCFLLCFFPLHPLCAPRRPVSVVHCVCLLINLLFHFTKPVLPMSWEICCMLGNDKSYSLCVCDTVVMKWERELDLYPCIDSPAPVKHHHGDGAFCHYSSGSGNDPVAFTLTHSEANCFQKQPPDRNDCCVLLLTGRKKTLRLLNNKIGSNQHFWPLLLCLKCSVNTRNPGL